MYDDRQRQLTSTWLNIMGAGIVSGGIVSQLVTVAAGATSLLICAAIIILCVLTGCGLHLVASHLARHLGKER